MRVQPRVLIAVPLLAAIVAWALARLGRPARPGVLWDRGCGLRQFARSAMTTMAD